MVGSQGGSPAASEDGDGMAADEVVADEVMANGGAASGGGQWVFACTAGEVEADYGTRVELEGGPVVAVYRVEERFYATADKCTHGEASLSEGVLEGHVVECPFHLGTFDVTTGEALTYPCVAPIATYPVRLDGDRILVRIA